jgi:hypothetical protein
VQGDVVAGHCGSVAVRSAAVKAAGDALAFTDTLLMRRLAPTTLVIATAALAFLAGCAHPPAAAPVAPTAGAVSTATGSAPGAGAAAGRGGASQARPPIASVAPPAGGAAPPPSPPPPPAPVRPRACPAVLARDQPYVTDLAVFGDGLYWISEGTLKKGFADGAIRRVALGAGGAPETVAEVWGPRGLLVDASGVYWTAEPTVLLNGHYVGASPAARLGTIWRRPLADGAPVEIARGLADPLFVAPDADRLFVSTGRGRSVVALARGASGAAAGRPLAEVEGRVSHLALDPTHVYFTVDEYHTGKVARVPRDGGRTEVLADGLDRPWGIAVDDAFVYFTTQGGYQGTEQLGRLPKAGGPVEALAQLPRPHHLVRHGAALYVATDRGIAKVDRAGGAPRFLSNDAANVFAADGSYLYVASTGDDTIACVLDPD